MLSLKVTVTNAKGFHLRPASKLVEIAGRYPDACAQLVHPERGNKADCRNMMALMMMSCPMGTELGLEIEGEQAQALADAIQTLFNSGFGD